MGTVKYTGPVASFHCPTSAEIRSLKVHFSPKQLGEGTPSPDNVREIEGWDGVDVYDRSQNLIASETEWLPDKWIIDKGKLRHSVYYSFYIPAPKGTFYIHKNKTGLLAYGGLIDRPPEIGDTAYEGVTLTSYLNRTVNNEDGHPYLLLCGPSSNPNKSLGEWLIENEVWIDLINSSSFIKPYHGSTTNYTFGVLGKNKFPLRASNQFLDTSTGNSNTIARDMTTGDVYVNISSNNYWPGKASTRYGISIGDGSVSFHSNDTSYGIGVFAPVLPNTTYTLSHSSFGGKTRIGYYNADGQHLNVNISKDTDTITFTTNSETAFILVVFCSISGNDSDYTVSNIQLELGSTATTYEPYNPNHTVYGGWVDLISGEVCEEYIAKDMGQIDWNKSSSGNKFYIIGLSPSYPWQSDLTMYCSIYKFDGTNVGNTWYGDNYTMRYYYQPSGNSREIYIHDERYDNVQDFKTAMNGINLVYPLATPNTYYLAPTQLQTFLGHNNVWSNADYVEVEYDLHETQDILARKQFIMASQPHVEEASGAIATFTTDMAVKLKECKVGFKPKQDLHGYSKPWVGGAGKNLFNENDITYGTWTTGDGSVLNAAYGCITNNRLFIAANTTVYLTIFGNDLYSKALIFYNTDGTYNTRQYSTGTTQLIYTTQIDCYLAIEFANGTTISTPITEEYVKAAKAVLSIGSTATSYEPYENICPIEGWNGIIAGKASKNLLDVTLNNRTTHQDFTFSNGVVNTRWVGNGNSTHVWFNQVFAPGTYTISCDYSGEGTNGPRLICSTPVNGGTWNNSYQGYWKNFSGRLCTFTAEEPFSVALVLISRADHYGEPGTLYNIQLELGSSATEYESYNGETIPITFPMLGKNYYNAEITTKTQNGVQWSGGEYYTIVASGTPTDYSCIVTGACEIPTSGKICLSANFNKLTNIVWDNYSLYDSNMNLLISTGGGGTGYKVIDLDTYTDPKYIKLSFKRGNNNVAVSGTIKPMIEVGEAPTAYEAYNVVYGGYVDLVNGELVQTHKQKILDGTENWTTYKGVSQPGYHFVLTLNDKKIGLNNTISDTFPNANNIYFWDRDNELAQFGDHSTNHNLYFNAPYAMVGGITEWETWLSEHNITIVYPLETPISYFLSPTKLKSLRGINNVWSNTNDNITVKYWKH